MRSGIVFKDGGSTLKHTAKSLSGRTFDGSGGVLSLSGFWGLVQTRRPDGPKGGETCPLILVP